MIISGLAWMGPSPGNLGGDTQMEASGEKTAFRLAIHIPRQISESPPTDCTYCHCECVWCGPTPEK